MDLIGLKSLRIFISYSSKNKKEVGELKKYLDPIGFEVFLAHEDLKPCVEWQDEIIKSLKRCDIFIAFLTKEFKESDWASQEIGIAVSENKFIVPVQVNITPFGFIGGKQGLKIKIENLERASKEIIKAIINESKFGEDVKAFVINSFIESNTFNEAGNRTRTLMEFDKCSDEQVKRIYGATKENNQISGSWEARHELKKFFTRYKELFSTKELKEILGLLSA